MIKSIELSNFRSIIHSKAEFKPLTVIIGANGTGKSNVIKALDFISDIAKDSLEGAILSRGGMQALFPRALTREKIQAETMSLNWEVVLPKFANYPKNANELSIEHRIELSNRTSKVVRVGSEIISMNDPLRFVASLYRDSKQKDEAGPESVPNSTISFARNSKNTTNICLDADYTDQEDAAKFQLFLKWFGIPPAKGQAVSENIKLLIWLMEDRRVSRKRVQEFTGSINCAHKMGSQQCFLDCNYLPFLFSPHFRRYVSLLSTLRRYELLLNELRIEQQPGYSILSQDGKYMPSTASKLKANNNKRWSCVLDTLHDIAPQIIDVDVKKLRSAKEFIEFTEKANGRKVESWESSDGTLRAFAILLALETQESGSTVLVEEPELGLHPWAIRRLMRHIQNTIEDKGIQVIMTTHSTQVLESVTPEQVIVTTRTSDAGTKFQPLCEIVPIDRIEKGEIGKLWEEGLIGGIPE